MIFTDEKSPKSAGRKLSDTILSLQNTLNEKEKFLRNKLQANIIWDLDTLENQVIEHKVSLYYLVWFGFFIS